MESNRLYTLVDMTSEDVSIMTAYWNQANPLAADAYNPEQSLITMIEVVDEDGNPAAYFEVVTCDWDSSKVLWAIFTPNADDLLGHGTMARAWINGADAEFESLIESVINRGWLS